MKDDFSSRKAVHPDSAMIAIASPYIRRMLLLCALISCLAAPPRADAFTVPERLQYDLSWGVIKTGEAVLEVRRNGSGVQLISRAASAGWVSVFYKVEDLVVSTLKKGVLGGAFEDLVGLPYHYRITLREGKHRRDKELIISQEARRVTYINHLEKERKEYSTTGGPVLDPLSSFYYVRTLPLEVGKSVYINVVDGKKTYKAEVQVLRKEVVETPRGPVSTILIKPVIKSEGIFSRRGDILIWLTDDQKRVPVMLKTKVAVGSVKAMLVGGTY
ncbi:MAG: DUF3108 domain-containing protein [Nitrospirota bacterium]